MGLAVATPALVRALLRSWESTPELRGLRLAEREGCLGCHRPPAVEIPNPGSRWGSVPRFGAGNAFMYAPDLAAVEELIRFGARRKVLDDPALAAKRAAQPVRMPAYGERLGDAEVADLVAYVAVVEGLGLAKDPLVERGRALARDHGCTACHGVEGIGGVPNPGSLGGFVPGFRGGNYPDLVKDEAELREWILEGTSRRLERNLLVRFFWRRQALAMPAYRGRLADADLEALSAWIAAIRADAARPRG